MEPSQYRSHQQSPTYRSPEPSYPSSLVELAQSYERSNNHGPKTAAQQFAQQQLQQLQQQQQQQQLKQYQTPSDSSSPGSSTAVDSRATFGTLPPDSYASSKTTAATSTATATTITTATHESNMSDFGSAHSIDNELLHRLLNTTDRDATERMDRMDTNVASGTAGGHEEEEDQHRKRQGYQFKDKNDNNNTEDDDDEDEPLTLTRLSVKDNDFRRLDDIDNASRQTQDEELRGYRRTPRSHRYFLQLHNSGTCTTDGDDEVEDDDDDDDLESAYNKKNGDIGMNHDGSSDFAEGGNGIWYDYQPDYGMLNESYQTTKRNIYKEIQLTLGHLQQLEARFESSKIQFHERIEKEYETWSTQLDLQKQSLIQQKRLLDDGEPQNLTTFPNKIKLNVGGDIFETSLATLKRDRSSLLAAMFSGKHPMDPDHEGSYFIDRDPTHFRLVLNYLRDLRISPSVIQDKVITQELLQEAQFYHIDGLIKLLEQ